MGPGNGRCGSEGVLLATVPRRVRGRAAPASPGPLPRQAGAGSPSKSPKAGREGTAAREGAPPGPYGKVAARPGPSFAADLKPGAPAARPAPLTFLPLPSRGSDSARPAPRAPGEAVVFWPGGRRGPAGGGGGGAAAPGASSASLPPWYTARPSEMWMLGAQPMLAAARRTRWRAAAIRSANGPPGASGPPRAPCHRRLGGRRRRARVSRQEVRPPLLSRCGRGGGGAGEGALGRAARRGRPSEHALPEAGAAGRLPHIAALAWPRRASGEFRGRRFALSQPGSGGVRAARATPP